MRRRDACTTFPSLYFPSLFCIRRCCFYSFHSFFLYRRVFNCRFLALTLTSSQLKIEFLPIDGFFLVVREFDLIKLLMSKEMTTFQNIQEIILTERPKMKKNHSKTDEVGFSFNLNLRTWTRYSVAICFVCYFPNREFSNKMLCVCFSRARKGNKWRKSRKQCSRWRTDNSRTLSRM